jgi:hypothetical protein
MPRTLVPITLAVVILATVPGRAAEVISLHANNAGELADLCVPPNPREPGADAKINFCHGFAQGAVDAVRRRAEELKKFCFPSNPPPRGVIMTEFANWARALPAHRAEPAIDGLFHFLGERFPCK